MLTCFWIVLLRYFLSFKMVQKIYTFILRPNGEAFLSCASQHYLALFRTCMILFLPRPLPGSGRTPEPEGHCVV